LAYNYNNDPSGPPGMSPGPGISTAQSSTESASTAVPTADPALPAAVPVSVGFARFNSCRWQQPIEDGNAAFCTHREVKPYAGATGFDADAWCTECQYYKLRRAPKKRTPNDDYSY
jgi:hypothetical protein